MAWRELCLVTLHPSPAVCTPRHRSRGTARHCACAAGCQGLRKGGVRGFWQGQTPAPHGSPKPSRPPSQCLMPDLIALDAYVHCPMVCGCLSAEHFRLRPQTSLRLQRQVTPASSANLREHEEPSKQASLAFAIPHGVRVDQKQVCIVCIIGAHAACPTQIKGCARCRQTPLCSATCMLF